MKLQNLNHYCFIKYNLQGKNIRITDRNKEKQLTLTPCVYIKFRARTVIIRKSLRAPTSGNTAPSPVLRAFDHSSLSRCSD